MRLLRDMLSAALLAALLAVPVRAQDAKNMTLFDHLNPVDSVGLHSALWGYTAPNGREYALFGAQDGTHIIDITDKPIRQVSYIWGPHNTWREMKVYKNYAYVVTEAKDTASAQGVQIIDLSQLPDTARLVRTDSSGFISAHTVYVHDHYLYAMGTYRFQRNAEGQRVPYGVNGVVIMDLEPDPTHPHKVAEFGSYYFHDAWVRNDTLLGAAVYGQGCDIWDIHDLSNPKYLTTITYPYSGTHNAEMTSRGHYVTTSDEIGGTRKTMKVWDISDLENIRKVADYTTRPYDIVHNVHTVGRYTIASWYTAGVRVIDMDDPVHPREVGYYDTYPGQSGTFDGVWEAYSLFPSGKIIASDRNTGLYVLQFNGAVGGSVSGKVIDAASHNALSNVSIIIPETGEIVTTDAFGRYYVGGVSGESVTLRTHQFGYQGTSETITMDGDVQHDITLATVPLLPFSLGVQAQSGAPIDSFAVAVQNAAPSASVANPVRLVLPRDTMFTATVGKWGYQEQRVGIVATADGQSTTVTLRPRYEDSASLDLGWSYADPGDAAYTGRWVRIVPYLSTVDAGWAQPATEPGGTDGYVFETGAPAHEDIVPVNDVNGGTTTLTSPSMDFSQFEDPTITFDLWCVHYEQDTVRDSLRVQISNDDGRTWVTAYKEAKGRPGWRTHYIYAKDLLPLTDKMRVRFRASDTLGNAIMLAAVDNVQVYETRVVPSSGVDVAAAPVTVAVPGEITVLPNPAREHPTLAFISTGASNFRLDIFDGLGHMVARLYDGPLAAGSQRFAVGGDLADGWYIVRGVDEKGKACFGRFQIVH